MKVKQLKPRSVITAAPSETLRSAAKRLSDDDIGILAIYGMPGAVGIFSERDLARAAADNVDIDVVQIKDYMTSAPLIVDAEDPITTAISQMNEYGVRHLLVSEDGDITGVVSARDLVRHLDAVPAPG